MTVTKSTSLLPSRPVRRGILALGGVLLVSGLALPASARAQTDELDRRAAERAADAIEQSRREADAAAQAFADAETQLEQATAELDVVLAQQADVAARVGSLREQVRDLALYRYVNGTGGTSPLLALTSDSMYLRPLAAGSVSGPVPVRRRPVTTMPVTPRLCGSADQLPFSFCDFFR